MNKTLREKLEEFFEIDLSKLTDEEIFELKREYDKWWKEALKRLNNIHK